MESTIGKLLRDGSKDAHLAVAGSTCSSAERPQLWRVEEALPVSFPSGIMTAAAWILREMGIVATRDAMLDWDPKQCSARARAF